MTLSIIILTLSFILGVMFHELGHLIVAKKCGLPVKTYCIGFGKPFVKRTAKDGTVYGIGWLPFGGYCDIPEDKLYKAPLKHFIPVLLAGVGMNFLFALILMYTGLCFIGGTIVNPLTGISFYILKSVELIGAIPETFKAMFNLSEMAQYGGVVENFKFVGSTISQTYSSGSAITGMTLIIGASLNVILGFFNILPIPCLDGGHIACRLVIEGTKNFKHKFTKKTADRISAVCMTILLISQFIYLGMDIPFFRNLFL